MAELRRAISRVDAALDRFGRWLSLMVLRKVRAFLVGVGASALLLLCASLMARVEYTSTPVLASVALVGGVTGLLVQRYYRRVKMIDRFCDFLEAKAPKNRERRQG